MVVWLRPLLCGVEDEAEDTLSGCKAFVCQSGRGYGKGVFLPVLAVMGRHGWGRF